MYLRAAYEAVVQVKIINQAKFDAIYSPFFLHFHWCRPGSGSCPGHSPASQSRWPTSQTAWCCILGNMPLQCPWARSRRGSADGYSPPSADRFGSERSSAAQSRRKDHKSLANSPCGRFFSLTMLCFVLGSIKALTLSFLDSICISWLIGRMLCESLSWSDCWMEESAAPWCFRDSSRDLNGTVASWLLLGMAASRSNDATLSRFVNSTRAWTP